MRRWADAHVDRPVARMIVVGGALKRRSADVLYLGDSSLIHISHQDTDRRRMGEMLADSSGAGVAQFYAPGTSVSLFTEVIRLARDLPPPRCVVVSLLIRNSTHVHATEHPIFGWQHAADVLRCTPSFGPRLAVRLYRKPPTAEDYARFEAISRRSAWGLGTTIGEYRARLRGYDPNNADLSQRQLIFDYFHGEFSDGHPGLERWRQLGEQLRKWGVPVVAYRSPMPLEAGTRLLGPDFRPHVERNFSLIEDQLFAGLGGRQTVPSAELSDDCFVNWADATEHLNERGRHKVIDAIAPAIRAHLA